MTEPSSSGSAPSSNRNLMIVLAYLWILALVPLLTEKNDREVQWHAKHGLVLMVAEIVFWIAFTIVTNILTAVTLGLGCVTVLLAPLISLAILAIHIVAIVKGINGQRFIVPGLSEFTEKF